MKPATLSAAALCLLLCACGSKRETEGVWTVVSAEKDAKLTKGPKKEQLEKAKFTFKGDTYAIVAEDSKRGEGTYTIDPKKDPKEIDLTSGEKSSLIGIYKLEGEELTLCYTLVGLPNSGRPQTFEAKAGSNRILLVLRRGKP